MGGGRSNFRSKLRLHFVCVWLIFSVMEMKAMKVMKAMKAMKWKSSANVFPAACQRDGAFEPLSSSPSLLPLPPPPPPPPYSFITPPPSKPRNGGTKEAPRRHQGGTKDAPGRHQGGTKEPRRMCTAVSGCTRDTPRRHPDEDAPRRPENLSTIYRKSIEHP